MLQDISNPLKLGFATFFLNRTNVSGVIKGGVIGGAKQNGKDKIDARFTKTTLIKKIQNIAYHRDRIILSNIDAKEFLHSDNIKQYREAFINLDPPYVAKGTQLYENSFTEEDHRVLSNIIARCEHKWMVTYDVCPLVAELYRGFRCSFLNVTYTVQNITKSKEYVFFSNNLKLPSNITLYPIAVRQIN